MYDELVKRLRERAAAFDYDGWMETAIDYEKAADAIEKLGNWWAQADKLIQMLEMPHWVPVAERLPEPYKSVLLYSGEEVFTGYMHNDRRFTVKASEFPDRPTHWMPLPEPPKEE